jgi:hypothetical protein
MSGLSISESTVERTIEDTGRRVKERLDAGQTQGPRQSWAWQRDAQGRTCAYVSLDHTGVRQQGPAVPRFPRSQDFLGPKISSVPRFPRSQAPPGTALSARLRLQSRSCSRSSTRVTATSS